MPIETNRLKLPLPLGNEGVSRVGINSIFEKIDEGVATREDVEELRRLINEIDIPDASLSQKGIVQLSNATGSSSITEAATPKAVKVAYDRGSEGVTAAQSAQAIINNRDGYGTTTNSGNAYTVTLTPAPTAYVDGLRITIKINSANTGAVTINVNGLGAKGVLKSNGSDLTVNGLRANSVYSLVYNGTAFILQGEGGEYGTAVAGDVLVGKTIGTENGIVTGTIPDRGAGGTVIPGNSDIVKSAGFYNTPITIKKVSATALDLSAVIPASSNILLPLSSKPTLLIASYIQPTGNSYVSNSLINVGDIGSLVFDPNSPTIRSAIFYQSGSTSQPLSTDYWTTTSPNYHIYNMTGTTTNARIRAYFDNL